MWENLKFKVHSKDGDILKTLIGFIGMIVQVKLKLKIEFRFEMKGKMRIFLNLQLTERLRLVKLAEISLCLD